MTMHNSPFLFIIKRLDTFGALPYVLPVTPESFQINSVRHMVSHQLMGRGEIVRGGHLQTAELVFTSIFPEHVDTYTNEQNPARLEPPHVWVARFNSMLRTPVLFTISDINFYGTYLLTNFTHTYIGGVGKEIAYEAAFKEVKASYIRSYDATHIFPQLHTAPVAPFVPNVFTYIVQVGDTLALIARKTGVSEDSIIRINNILNVDRIVPGTVLKLQFGTIPFNEPVSGIVVG